MATSDSGLPSPARLEAFSDGVIAIAITLLILDLKVPEVDVGALGPALRTQWPAYLGYATSFVTIGIMWVNHHSLFDRIERVDRGLLFTNLGLLFGIATLPFTTSLAARWLRAGADGRIAVVIYCASLGLVSATFVALWTYLARRPELLPERHQQLPAVARRRARVGPIAYTIAAGIAALSAPAGFAACALVAAYFVRPHRRQPAIKEPT
jgi:uncharacterized membrane protein